MRAPGIDRARVKYLRDPLELARPLCKLSRQHRKLENENGSGRGGDGKERLREPDGKDFVCHVLSRWIELIER
jgi:hypothetical protein